jgi:hypothetical protein
MEACVHRMLYCSATCGRVSLSGLWPKAELGSTHGIGLVYSILFQNGTLIRPASTRFVIGLQSPCSRNRFVQVGVYGGGWIYGGGSDHEDSSHNILTLDALQVLSRSQVTPELSMSMRIRPI